MWWFLPVVMLFYAIVYILLGLVGLAIMQLAAPYIYIPSPAECFSFGMLNNGAILRMFTIYGWWDLIRILSALITMAAFLYEYNKVMAYLFNDAKLIRYILVGTIGFALGGTCPIVVPICCIAYLVEKKSRRTILTDEDIV